MKPLRSLLSFVAFVLLLGVFAPAWAAAPPPPIVLPADVKEFRSVAQAITTRISRAAPAPVAAQPGYLGVTLEVRDGKLTVLVQTADQEKKATSPKAVVQIRTFGPKA